MSGKGRIQGIFGPVVKGWTDFPVFLYEVVRVGEKGLLGEVIRIDGDVSDIQVYEDTEGLRVGEDIRFTGELLSVDLGPGLLGNVFDGIGRPLELISGNGCFIQRGSDAPNLPPDRKWPFTPVVDVGDLLEPGDVIGEVREGSAMTHMVMAPPGTVPSSVDFIAPRGDYSVSDILCTTEEGLRAGLSQRWQVRRARPVAGKINLLEPLVTGQRIIDTLFPVALGGAAVVPGGFGTGKTVTQQSLAKWCNADVIIYIGCGERGNEMTEVLEEFPTLIDPSTGEPLMDRMILIANTSNMPVAAREASIYLGMTFGEYFRDMGKNVAIMADSTSRWAEALREIGGRLEEMPGEEGYPAYLGSRLSQYY
ncbi:MAG: V-type ATP synthase subunit A, partial [Synergistota bacterium]|nr:V-type ATP synthase subunit A [Synergistota bacterium]